MGLLDDAIKSNQGVTPENNPPSAPAAAPAAAPTAPAGGSLLNQALAANTGVDTTPPPPATPARPPAPKGMMYDSTGVLRPYNPQDWQSQAESGIGQFTDWVGHQAETVLAHPVDLAMNLLRGPMANTGGEVIPATDEDVDKHLPPALRAFRDARAQGKSIWESQQIANHADARASQTRDLLEQSWKEFKARPVEASVRTLLKAVAIAASVYGSHGLASEGIESMAVSRAAAQAKAEAEALNPTPTQPGIIQQIRQGAGVAQPGAKAAIRAGAAASEKAYPAVAPETPATPAATTTPVPEGEGNSIGTNQHGEDIRYQHNQDTHTVTTHADDGTNIGTMVAHDTKPGEVTVSTNQINDPALQGKGRGTDAMRSFLDNSSSHITTVKSDISTTTPARGLWRNLMEERPDAVTEKVYKDGQTQYTVNMNKWRNPPEVGEGEGATGTAKAPAPAPVPTSGRLVEGNTSALDPQLQNLENQKAAAYAKGDKVAGFDVKALKDKLSTDQYNLKQLGSSDPDKAGRLIEAINDSQSRITEAEAKMRAEGIDPDEADRLNKAWEAGHDMRKKLVRRVDAATGDLNLKGTMQDFQELRNNQRYGDRLEQFMGSKEAADKLMADLNAEYAKGVKALSRQALAKKIATYGILTAGGATLLHATHIFNHLTGAVEPVQ